MSGEEEFAGKVCIVTGASSGLGQATAVMLARRGAMVTLCGRDQERLNQVHHTCTQASGGHADRFITVQGDLTQHQVRQEVVDKTVEKFGQLDVLVTNAGAYTHAGTLRDATEETFDLLFDTNVKSVFFLIQQSLPHLETSKGCVVSVSSVATRLAFSPIVLYPMTKAAVDHMTRCLALDLGPKGIRVNAVNPSYVPTRIRRDFPGLAEEVQQKKVEIENNMHPLGKCGTPDDVAQAICFLASDSAKFITGECLLVDGGRSLTGAIDTWSKKAATSW